MNVLRLQSWMMNAGYRIVLYCCEKTPIHQKAMELNLPVQLIKKPGKKFDFAMAYRISVLLKRNDVKLVFIGQNYDLDVFNFAKRLFHKNLKLVYHQQMQIGIDKSDPIHTFRYASLDKWISPLHCLKVEVGKRTRFPLEKVEVIPLCVDVEPYRYPKYTKEEARISLGIQVKAPLIGIMGRISPKKGQGFIIKSLEKLLKKGIQAELLIVGSATVNDELCQSYDREIREYVRINGLEQSVHFRAHMEDAVKFYHAIDIFVMSSHGETFGMVTVEAMLSGVPVAGTNSGGTPEILDYGKLGYLFEFENMDSFCDVIERMLSNPSECGNKALLAQSTAENIYNHHREVQLISEMLQKL